MSGHSIRVGPVAALAAFAVSRGVPFDRVTAEIGLTLADLIDAERRLSDRIPRALWDLILEASPGEAVGLEMARMAPMRMLGAALHVASFAETLREALHVAVRYRRVVASALSLSLHEGPELAVLRMAHPYDRQGPTPAPEAGLAVQVRMLREVFGVEDALARVELSQPPVGPVEVYADFFGVEVRFEQPFNAIVLHSPALDRPTAQGDATAFTRISAHFDQVHRALVDAAEDPELMRIKTAINESARRGQYGVDAVARRLAVSVRSLQRTVAGHGTTMRALVDHARRQHAERLLSDPSLNVDEVAFLLDYADSTSFRRAFKRWTGLSPRQARRSG